MTDVPLEKVEYSEADGNYGFEEGDPNGCITDIKEVHNLAAILYPLDSPAQADFQIVDARSKGRFEGTAPEPRPGVRGGCIKNSLNLPFNEVLNPDGTIKSKEELLEMYKTIGISTDKKTINTCGSGLTACVNILAQ